MTRKERMRRCYFNEETDRPAVFSRPGFPGDDPTYDRLKAYLAARADQKKIWWGSRYEPAPRVDSRSEPYSADFERRIETLHTPKGPLTRTTLVSLRGQPGLHETYYIKEPADVDRYLSLPEPKPVVEADGFAAAVAAMGDTGIVDATLGFNPGGTAVELCGSETFAALSVTDRETLLRLCERRMRVMLALVKKLLAAGVGPFFSMAGQEYIVPPMHGPADFADFNVRYDKPVLDLVHAGGGRVHIHCHGSLRKVFAQFVEAGADVLHPVEPPPLGDLPAREAKAMARGRVCIEGNIQIHRMYEGEPDSVRAETEQLIADAFDDGRGLIVSPTASPYIRGLGESCFSRYEAMVEAVLAHGRGS